MLAGDPPRTVWSETGQARRKSVVSEKCLAPVQISLHSTPSADARPELSLRQYQDIGRVLEEGEDFRTIGAGCGAG